MSEEDEIGAALRAAFPDVRDINVAPDEVRFIACGKLCRFAMPFGQGPAQIASVVHDARLQLDRVRSAR